MRLFDFLERLREEPESHRRRTAFVVALSVTGLVALGWFMSWSGGSRVSYTSTEATSSPLTVLAQTLTEGREMFHDLFGALGESRDVFIAPDAPPEESEN